MVRWVSSKEKKEQKLFRNFFIKKRGEYSAAYSLVGCADFAGHAGL